MSEEVKVEMKVMSDSNRNLMKYDPIMMQNIIANAKINNPDQLLIKATKDGVGSSGYTLKNTNSNMVKLIGFDRTEVPYDEEKELAITLTILKSRPNKDGINVVEDCRITGTSILRKE